MATRKILKRKKMMTPKEGPYIKTKRAKAMPGKTVAVGGTVVIKKMGKKPLSFKKGALREQLGVPEGEKIPREKVQQAAKGEYGSLAKKIRFWEKDKKSQGVGCMKYFDKIKFTLITITIIDETTTKLDL